MITKYCFIAENYIGKMIFYDNGEIKMQWEPEEKLEFPARNMKVFLPLSNTKEIQLFIGERVICRSRPDAGVWLGMIGLTPNCSDLDIFFAAHGVSINDYFWINDTLDNSLWKTKLGVGR